VESAPHGNSRQEDDAGNRNLVDLRETLKLPIGAVIQAFVAEQDEKLKIYLAVAVKNDKNSDVYVCKPFLLDNLGGITLYPKQTMPTVNKLFMVSAVHFRSGRS